MIDFNRLYELYERALAYEGSERAAFLSHVSAESPDLRAWLDKLLVGSPDAASPPDGTSMPDGGEGDGWLRPGAQVDRWILLGHVRCGGMGSVYVADDAEEILSRHVAIKFMRENYYPDELLVRFRQERHILAQLHHPHVVRIVDGGTYKGREYIVMDFVDGEPLDQYCERTSLGKRDRLTLFASICDAVAALHERGVIHGDLTPNNILVNADGHFTIVDFGIAVSRAPAVGTIAFASEGAASPQQQVGLPLSIADDIYLLGSCLRRILEPLSSIPRSVASIVSKATAADPKARFASAEEVSLSIRRALLWRRAVPRLAAVFLVLFIIGAWWNNDRAASQSVAVASESLAQLANDPLAAVRTALRAASVARTETAEHALRKSLTASHRLALQRHKTSVRALAFGETGTMLASTAADGTAAIWNVDSGLLVRSFTTGYERLFSVSFAARDRLLVTKGDFDYVQIWSISSGAHLYGIDTSPARPTGPYTSRFDRLKLRARQDPTPALEINNWRGELVSTLLPEAVLPAVVAFNDAEKVIAFFHSATHSVLSFDIASGRRLASIVLTSNARRIVFSPSGDSLLVLTEDGQCLVIDTNPWTIRARATQHLANGIVSGDRQNVVFAGASAERVVVFDRHSGRVLRSFSSKRKSPSAISVSRNGRYVAVGYANGDALAWEWRTGVVIAVGGHTGAIDSIALRGDDAWLVTESADGTARVWDMVAHESVLRLRWRSPRIDWAALQRTPGGIYIDHTSNNGGLTVPVGSSGGPLILVSDNDQTSEALPGAKVLAATYSPDGSQLAAVVDRNAVLTWRVGQPGPPTVITHDAPVKQAVFSPNGRRLLTTDQAGLGTLTDVDTGKWIVQLDDPFGAWTADSFSDDGSSIAFVDTAGAGVWDVGTGQIGARFQAEESIGFPVVAFSRDHTRFARGLVSGTVSVWRLPQAVGALKGLTASVRSVSLAPNMSHATAANRDRVSLWDVRSRNQVAVVDATQFQVNRGMFDSRGARVVLPDTEHGLGFWDMASAKVDGFCCRVDGSLIYAMFSPDDRLVLAVEPDGRVSTWLAHGGQRLATIRKPTQHSLFPTEHLPHFSGDSTLVATLVSGRLELSKTDRDVPDTAVGDSTAGAVSVTSAAFGPQSATLAVATKEQGSQASITLHRLDTGTKTSMTGPLSDPWQMAFDNLGRRVAAAADKICVWNTLDGQLVRCVQPVDLAIALRFAASGRFLLTMTRTKFGLGGHAIIWDLETGDSVFDVPAVSADISDDGTFLLAGMTDGTVRIFDTSTATAPFERLISLAERRLINPSQP